MERTFPWTVGRKIATLRFVMLTAKEKEAIVKEHGSSVKDVGSTSVQIALLTERISQLTEHLKVHKKDFHTERGLTLMVGRRRRLLDYLAKEDNDGYLALIKKLKLRR